MYHWLNCKIINDIISFVANAANAANVANAANDADLYRDIHIVTTNNCIKMTHGVRESSETVCV